MNDCIIPIPRSSDNRWLSQHTRHIHECKEAEPEVLLIGDSIIQKMIYFDTFWDDIASLHPLNLGIGGDRTENILWRLQNGAVDQTHPRVVVLHCGTNNHGNTSQQISEGVLKILEDLQKRFPSAHIIVWGLLPRGEYPNKVCDRNKEVNNILKERLQRKPQVELVCSGDMLRDSDGRISAKDMYDYLHLTEQGYVKSFAPVLERLKEILAA